MFVFEFDFVFDATVHAGKALEAAGAKSLTTF
jgi:hypothetical protein